MFMTHQQASELAQPGVGSFDHPTPLVASQFTPIFVAGAVAIVAIDEASRVLLVRKYRAGAARETLEIPAGTLKEGEDPALCATRELKEETGYSASQWEPMGAFFSSPGFCTERMFLFLARKLTPGTATPEEDESITVEGLALAQAPDAIERGEILDAKTIVGLLRVWRKLESEHVNL